MFWFPTMEHKLHCGEIAQYCGQCSIDDYSLVALSLYVLQE